MEQFKLLVVVDVRSEKELPVHSHITEYRNRADAEQARECMNEASGKDGVYLTPVPLYPTEE